MKVWVATTETIDIQREKMENFNDGEHTLKNGEYTLMHLIGHGILVFGLLGLLLACIV